MWLRLKQICLVATDIEAPTALLHDVFGIEVCHIDDAVHQYGLVNRLMPVGNQLLEIVSPTRPGTAAGRYLERRKGDGGYMVITQCDDLRARRARVDTLGVRVANALEHHPFNGMQLHPRDTGGALFEIDEQSDDYTMDGAWHPAGADWQSFRQTDIVNAISAAELQSPDPLALAERWAEIIETSVTRSGKHFEIALDNATLRFVAASDGRGEGLGALDLKAVDAPAAQARARAAGCLDEHGVVTICGIRLHLV